MRNRLFLTLALICILACLLTAIAQAANPPVMDISSILEQRYKDDDLALVVPDRLEMICEAGPSSPWGFCFAGFETSWRNPIELEVTGSGGYEVHDSFSFAGITLDYGRKDGWSERSFIGLGLIQGSRTPHPPSWGVGGVGKIVVRGNLADAGPQPKRVTIDPAKYAPQDWDGRLWIGLCTHNIGVGKTLRARVVSAAPASTLGPELDRDAKWKLLQEHQKAYLASSELKFRETIRQTEAIRNVRVAPEMMPYARTSSRQAADRRMLDEIGKARKEADKGVVGAARFLQISSAGSDPSASCIAAARAEAASVHAMNRLLDSWKKSGRYGREIGCIVRTVSNLQNVGLTDVASGRVLANNAEPIRISAARHEYEGFQIVLSPLDGCAKRVSIAVSELKRGGSRIPKSEIKVNPVGYLRLNPGEAGEALVPDPLLICPIPELAAGENQPVWITIRVPDNTPAGDYKGHVQISSAGVKPLRVPIVLTVRDFAIPHKISLRSSFWMFRDQINRFYGLDEVKLDDYFKWIDMALEHRLCPIDVVEGRCKSLVDVIIPEKGSQLAGVPNPNPDFTQWDRYIDRMVAGGASTIHMGLSHHYGAWFSDEANKTASPVQVERVIESLKVLREHYKKKGVFDLHYVQLRDETSAPESLNVYRDVQKALPDLKLLLTAPSGDAKPFLDIPCPLTPSYDSAWQKEVKANGGEYWWYVCLVPTAPWANVLLNQTAAAHRVLFWQTWDRKIDGLLYWGMNFWRWYEANPAPGTVATSWAKETTGPNWRVPPADASNFCPIPSAPGDGFSMYPGPTPSQPLSSIRLENMRDGEEDYEYFILLDDLIAKAKGESGKLEKAKAARDEARKLASPMTEYSTADAPYLEVREKVAKAIESLMH